MIGHCSFFMQIMACWSQCYHQVHFLVWACYWHWKTG